MPDPNAEDNPRSVFPSFLTTSARNVGRVLNRALPLRQNEDMRKITAWAAIWTVITSIAGIYGMYFDNMPELGWHYGYFLCLAIIASICVGLYISFRRNKWL